MCWPLDKIHDWIHNDLSGNYFGLAINFVLRLTCKHVLDGEIDKVIFEGPSLCLSFALEFFN